MSLEHPFTLQFPFHSIFTKNIAINPLPKHQVFSLIFNSSFFSFETVNYLGGVFFFFFVGKRELRDKDGNMKKMEPFFFLFNSHPIPSPHSPPFPQKSRHHTCASASAIPTPTREPKHQDFFLIFNLSFSIFHFRNDELLGGNSFIFIYFSSLVEKRA